MPINRRKVKIGGAVVRSNVEDGKHVALIQGIELMRNELIKIKNVEKKKDILEVTFRLAQNGELKKRFIFSLVIGSRLIDFIEVATESIPDYIDDLEEMLVGKKLIVEVKNNESGGRKYSNIIKFYPISKKEEFELEDNVEGIEPKTGMDKFL